METAQVQRVLAALEALYPEAKAELHFTNPFELLIATILSAQCTDRQVNQVTRTLFQRFPDAASFAVLEPKQLEPFIRSCGFFKTKAEHIVQACRILMAEHNGQVPADREALQSLPGVGRKTASVVLSNAFGIDAIAVDTHVFRVTNRIGLADAKDVERTERQLMEAIPQSQWSIAHHWLIWHGRRMCSARAPRCGECPIRPDCRWAQQQVQRDETAV